MKPTPLPSASPTVSPTTYNFMLAGQGTSASTIKGTVQILLADNSFTVIVNATGLAPGTLHPAHIHSGTSCSANGPIIIALQDVVADDKGHSMTTTVIPQPYVVPTSSWYVNIHEGPDLIGAHSGAIACALLSVAPSASPTPTGTDTVGVTPTPSAS